MKCVKIIIVTVIITVILSVLCSCSGKSMTIEAGTRITASEITGDDGAVFGDNFDADCVNHAGKYTFNVISDGKECKVTLKVVDTKAPRATVKKAFFGIGSTVPDPVCFIDTIDEADDYTAEYTKVPDSFMYLGDYPVSFVITDKSGNRSPEYSSVLTLIKDTEPPVINGATDLVLYSGDAAAYRKNITLTDNCAGEIKLDVDSSAVKTDFPGYYNLIYTATDACGNRTSKTVTVHVYAEAITEQTLNSKLDTVISKIITGGMTTEQKCRAIYTYVHDSIAYVGSSDKHDWVSAAYEALFVSGSGDCYSYFAAAKAFMQRLGIENKDIQRLPGYVSDTHYWSLVNIGTSVSPVWYHFDCTRLTSDYNVSGCLLTDAQVDAYNTWRKGSYFRVYDKSVYPATATEIITNIPELRPYM